MADKLYEIKQVSLSESNEPQVDGSKDRVVGDCVSRCRGSRPKERRSSLARDLTRGGHCVFFNGIYI